MICRLDWWKDFSVTMGENFKLFLERLGNAAFFICSSTLLREGVGLCWKNRVGVREVSGEILQGLPVYNCLSISPLPCCQDLYEQAPFRNSWRFRQRISDEPLRNDRIKRSTTDSPDPDFYCKIGDDLLGKMKKLRKESALFAKTTPVPVLRKKRG